MDNEFGNETGLSKQAIHIEESEKRKSEKKETSEFRHRSNRLNLKEMGTKESETTLRSKTATHNQGTNPICFSYALSTALRSTLNWKKTTCDISIIIPPHEELQSMLSPLLTPNSRNCYQMCFPIKNINERLSLYGVEFFNIDTKDELLQAIDGNDSGVSVVVIMRANKKNWLEFERFGKPGGYGHEKTWDKLFLDYIPHKRHTKYITNPKHIRESKENNPKYLPPPVFPYKNISDSVTSHTEGASGHTMYVSGRGIDVRYKPGNKEHGHFTCSACGKGNTFPSVKQNIKEWHASNPGKTIQNCICKISTPYIELKNSWGENWGENGHIKIRESFIKKIIPLPKLNNTNSCKLGCGILGTSLRNLISREPVTWSFIGIRPINCTSVMTKPVDMKRGGKKKHKTNKKRKFNKKNKTNKKRKFNKKKKTNKKRKFNKKKKTNKKNKF
jgi:hypothetical protein